MPFKREERLNSNEITNEITIQDCLTALRLTLKALAKTRRLIRHIRLPQRPASAPRRKLAAALELRGPDRRRVFLQPLLKVGEVAFLAAFHEAFRVALQFIPHLTDETGFGL